MYAVRWAKMAAVYFAIGSILGLVMSITEKFVYAPVHAHLNLLGWASMALFAALYKVFPALEASRLAAWQFWAHQVFFPIFMVALFLIISGNSLGAAIIPIGSLPTIISILLFVANVWINLKKPAADSSSAARRSA